MAHQLCNGVKWSSLNSQPGSEAMPARMKDNPLPGVGHSIVKSKTISNPIECIGYFLDLLAVFIRKFVTR
jgi:hypothetical protein